MNYRSAGLAELSTLANEFDNYTVGQLLYAIINRKPEGVSLKEWLFTVPDEDMYTAIEETKLIERAIPDGIFRRN
jgi:hypothetical protein